MIDLFVVKQISLTKQDHLIFKQKILVPDCNLVEVVINPQDLAILLNEMRDFLGIKMGIMVDNKPLNKTKKTKQKFVHVVVNLIIKNQKIKIVINFYTKIRQDD